ncbi:reticulocyte-binding protein 2 homolog a-like [Gymnodraco acuticeps]|uniref:Reticulocyte-binding protein 2 homolog a-like n=2 Tax=Notothenioidei TaxID=8205 RepID=A0A6P8U8W1_GYMAC|nr:reticulocyte-binding protein 2 homolog a-like [Gymnodraco acuticeps]
MKMDAKDENMKLKEMREKMEELEHSLNQQRDRNAKLNDWLDVAEDDIAMLRPENILLRKRVKDLEKSNSEVQLVEAEPCRSLLDDELYAQRWSENKIQKLEKESAIMKEQNKKLTEEKNLQLKYSEELKEEYFNIIECLRQKNQELGEQLEDRRDTASLTIVNDLMEKKEETLSLSFAEELQLLAFSPEVKPSMADSADLRHEECEAEEPLKPLSLPEEHHTKRWAGTLETAVQIAGLFLLFIFFLIVLGFLASGSFRGNFFSINTLWSGTRLMLQPYYSVHYGALPPI